MASHIPVCVRPGSRIRGTGYGRISGVTVDLQSVAAGIDHNSSFHLAGRRGTFTAVTDHHALCLPGLDGDSVSADSEEGTQPDPDLRSRFSVDRNPANVERDALDTPALPGGRLCFRVGQSALFPDRGSQCPQPIARLGDNL